MCLLLMPMSSAASRSSDVARKARPSLVRARNSCSTAMTTTERRNTSSGNQPIESCSVTVTLMFSMVPASRPCESAENHMMSPFWMMIDNPNVTTIGRVSSLPSVKFSSPRWST